MENLVVAVFEDVRDATAGLDKLKELDRLGDITIYNLVMIRRTDENKFEFLHHEGPHTGGLAAGGAAAGGLIGALGGPIGLVIGMFTGIILGTSITLGSDEFSDDFLNRVNRKLPAGAFALVLDVEEEGESLINSHLEPYHGTVIHTSIEDQYEQYDKEKWKGAYGEIAGQELAWKNAEEHLHARIKVLGHKIAMADGKLRERLKAQKQNLEANLKKFFPDA